MFKIFVLSFFLFFFNKTYAFDFEALLYIASMEDPQVANAINSREIAIQRFENAKPFINPSSYLSINTMNNTAMSSGIPNTDPLRQSFPTSTASITVMQSIYNPIRKFNIDKAKLQLELEEIQVQQAKNELAVRLLQTLLDLSGAKLNTKSLESEVSLLREFLASQHTKDAETDLSSYQIRLIQAEGQVNLSRNIVKNKQRDLTRLGASSALKEEIKFNINEFELGLHKFPTLDDFLSRSEDDSLQLRFHKIAVQIANTTVNHTSRDAYPTVDLIANGSITRGMPNIPNAQSSSASIGLQVNLPLSNGSSSSSTRSEAISFESRAKNDLEVQRKLVQQSLSDSYHELQTVEIQLETESRLTHINNEKRNQTTRFNLDPEGEFNFATVELEEKIKILQSRREFNRLCRESVMYKFKILTTTGALEKNHFQLVNNYFEPNISK